MFVIEKFAFKVWREYETDKELDKAELSFPPFKPIAMGWNVQPLHCTSLGPNETTHEVGLFFG